MRFQLTGENVSLNKAVTDYYADVYLHVEQKKGSHSIFKANKVILALHSPYFDRIFRSSDNIHIFHMGFLGIKDFIINDALQMLYGASIQVLSKHVGRFSAFLQMLEIDFKSSDINIEEEKPAKKLKLSSDEPASKESVTSTESNSNVPKDITVQETQLDKSVESSPPQSPLTLPSQTGDALSSYKTDGTTKEASSVFNKEGSSSSSSSLRSGFKFTNKKGEPAFSDNWTDTETSETDLKETLQSIDFKLGSNDTGGHHQNYICCHCGLKVMAISKAKQHFINNHQNSEEEIRIIEEIIKYKKTAVGEINQLNRNIQGGSNQEMATCQLISIIHALHKHSKTLQSLIVKNLPPNLLRKRDDLINAIGETVRSVENYIGGL